MAVCLLADYIVCKCRRKHGSTVPRMYLRLRACTLHSLHGPRHTSGGSAEASARVFARQVQRPPPLAEALYCLPLRTTKFRRLAASRRQRPHCVGRQPKTPMSGVWERYGLPEQIRFLLAAADSRVTLWVAGATFYAGGRVGRAARRLYTPVFEPGSKRCLLARTCKPLAA